MKLELKEDPKEWRKAAWMAAGGLTVLSSVLRWRRVLANPAWLAALCALASVAVVAAIQPRLFRGFYRFTKRIEFAISRVVGFVALVIFFFVIMAPAALVMRVLGKDPLQLRRGQGRESYWSDVRRKSSLDRLF